MRSRYIGVNGDTFDKANEILEEYGLNATSAIRMMLDRVVKENNADFLVDKKIIEKPPTLKHAIDIKTMNKNVAIDLFTKEGHQLNGMITFASKNRSADIYWANPYFSALQQNWNLILNDTIRREIILFVIPGNTFRDRDFMPKYEDKRKIELQIKYNDKTFTDIKSNISFYKYCVSIINY